MLSAIIVDDELNNREFLAEMLNKFFPGRIRVTALCDSVQAGIQAIENTNPDVVFLDIEMPNGNSFSLIESTRHKSYRIVFVTAYSQYAADAFKVDAVDYLLKPLRKDDLGRALDKLERSKPGVNQDELLRKILAASGRAQSRLGLPTLKGTVFVEVPEIIRCEAEGSYTVFHFGDRTMMVSRVLKEVEEILQPYNFCRVHKSHLVNLDKVLQYSKADGGTLLMQDRAEIPVSRAAKDDLDSRLNML